MGFGMIVSPYFILKFVSNETETRKQEECGFKVKC
jgi:hypothetical protein